jgi:hypothetical protein
MVRNVATADESERGGRATMKVNLAVQIDRSTSKTHSDRLDDLSCRAREVTGVASHSPVIHRELIGQVSRM